MHRYLNRNSIFYERPFYKKFVVLSIKDNLVVYRDCASNKCIINYSMAVSVCHH